MAIARKNSLASKAGLVLIIGLILSLFIWTSCSKKDKTPEEAGKASQEKVEQNKEPSTYDSDDPNRGRGSTSDSPDGVM